MNRQKFLILFIITLLLASCNKANETDESSTALIKRTDPDPTLITNESNQKLIFIKKIKKDVASVDEIYDVAVVKGKKDTLVVYKVKHLRRFQMKKIERAVLGKLNNKYPKENFTVSSDYKIFLEVVKLNKKMEDPHFSEKDAENNLRSIVKLTKEQT